MRNSRVILTKRKERAAMRHILQGAESYGTYYIELGHRDIDSLGENDYAKDIDLEKITGLRGDHLLRILHAKGYITKLDIDGWPEFRITDKGFMYFELDSERRRDIIMRSILIPILLSAITSILFPRIVGAIEASLARSPQQMIEQQPEYKTTDDLPSGQ